MKENGLSVSHPIKDLNGAYLQSILASEGVRYTVLFSFAEGSSIRMPSEKTCYQLCATLARKHSLSLNQMLERKNYDAETLAGWTFIKY